MSIDLCLFLMKEDPPEEGSILLSLHASIIFHVCLGKSCKDLLRMTINEVNARSQ